MLASAFAVSDCNYLELKGFSGGVGAPEGWRDVPRPRGTVLGPATRRGTLPGVKVKENESFEAAMKRFKKQCEKAGIMYELRRREHYEKPSVRRKKKALAARKRAIKKLRAASG